MRTTLIAMLLACVAFAGCTPAKHLPPAPPAGKGWATEHQGAFRRKFEHQTTTTGNYSITTTTQEAKLKTFIPEQKRRARKPLLAKGDAPTRELLEATERKDELTAELSKTAEGDEL